MVMFMLMVTNMLMCMVSGNVIANVKIKGVFNAHVNVSVTDSVNVAVKFTVDVDFHVGDNVNVLQYGLIRCVSVYVLLYGFDTLC